MKHLLNNMSEEEKNAIREQHTGGMKVMVENFNKLINSKLGDSKPLVAEQFSRFKAESTVEGDMKMLFPVVNLTLGNDNKYVMTIFDETKKEDLYVLDFKGPIKDMKGRVVYNDSYFTNINNNNVKQLSSKFNIPVYSI